jgi:hypothetical protein
MIKSMKHTLKEIQYKTPGKINPEKSGDGTSLVDTMRLGLYTESRGVPTSLMI